MTKKSLIILLGVGLGIGVAVFLVTSHLRNKNQPESVVQRQLSQQKATETITAVEKLMELPDEEPTVATVSDLATLQGQPFFAHAEEGDRVLFYTQAKKAILYRPTANKIIEVAALAVPTTK